MHEDKNILLVEDEAVLREHWTSALRRFGFRSVAGYEKAEDAVDESKRRVGTSRSFHLAVIDLKLTTSRREYLSDPWRLSKELKVVNPKLLLIAVSGHLTETGDQLHGHREVKVNDYIIKSEDSVQPDLFVERVLTVLRTHYGEPSPIFRFWSSAKPNRVFAFNCRTGELTGPEGAEIELGPPARWLLEHFLRNPKVRLDRDLPPDPALVPVDRPPGLAGAATAQDESELDAHERVNRTIREAIWRIRSGLGDDDIVRTEWGKGYSFSGKVECLPERA